MPTDPSARCPHCMVGVMTPAKAFYCQWSDGHFITAPDFPAWVCDVCGAREYEPQAVLELQTLIDMSHPTASRQARRPAPGREEAADLASTPPRRQP
jgi:YgiT-type zinc finger domain-containing protein